MMENLDLERKTFMSQYQGPAPRWGKLLYLMTIFHILGGN